MFICIFKFMYVYIYIMLLCQWCLHAAIPGMPQKTINILDPAEAPFGLPYPMAPVWPVVCTTRVPKDRCYRQMSLGDSHNKNHIQELLSALELKLSPFRIEYAWQIENPVSRGRSRKWLHMNCRNGTERMQLTFKITGGYSYESFQPNGRTRRVSSTPLIHMFLRG